MPEAVVAAAITGAAQLGGSALQSRSANRGYDAQAQAQRDALEFEREREETRRAEAEEIRRLQQEQYQAYQQYRQPFRTAAHSILSKYGIGTPAPPPDVAPEGWAPPVEGGPRGTPIDYSGMALGRSPAEGMVAPPISERPRLYSLGGP